MIKEVFSQVVEKILKKEIKIDEFEQYYYNVKYFIKALKTLSERDKIKCLLFLYENIRDNNAYSKDILDNFFKYYRKIYPFFFNLKKNYLQDDLFLKNAYQAIEDETSNKTDDEKINYFNEKIINLDNNLQCVYFCYFIDKTFFNFLEK